MLALYETVSFLGIVDRIHGAAFGFEDANHLLSFLARHADVVLALQDKQRRGLVANIL
jgi:hypothetical protein